MAPNRLIIYLMLNQKPVLLGLMIGALSGCGLVEAARNTSVAEITGLGIDVPCTIDRFEANGAVGALLRSNPGGDGSTIFSITGRPSWLGALPGNITIDDVKIRRIAIAEDGTLSGSLKAVAVPVTAVDQTTTPPAIYELVYSAEGTNYTGNLVLGASPQQAEMPKSGQLTVSGPIRLSVTTVDSDGSSNVTDAEGNFSLTVGYGSGRARFEANGFSIDSGPSLGFETLSWSGLGLCDPRIVSSGQGTASLIGQDGTRLPLFGSGTTAGTGKQQLESTHFAVGGDRPSPPNRVGGVFAIQGDSMTIEGVFLSNGA